MTDQITISVEEYKALNHPLQTTVEKANLMPIVTILLGVIFAFGSAIFSIVIIGGQQDIEKDVEGISKATSANAIAIVRVANEAKINATNYTTIMTKLGSIDGKLEAAGENRFRKSDGDKLDDRLTKVENVQRDRAHIFEKIREKLK